MFGLGIDIFLDSHWSHVCPGFNSTTHTCSRANDKRASFVPTPRWGGFLFLPSTTGQVTPILIPMDLWVVQDANARDDSILEIYTRLVKRHCSLYLYFSYFLSPCLFLFLMSSLVNEKIFITLAIKLTSIISILFDERK